MFRELLQNADDARATKVVIEFQTEGYATHSAGANGKTNGITTAIPDLLTTKVSSGWYCLGITVLSVPTAVQMGCSQQW